MTTVFIISCPYDKLDFAMNSIKNTGFMCHSREALNVAGIIFNIVCEY